MDKTLKGLSKLIDDMNDAKEDGEDFSVCERDIDTLVEARDFIEDISSQF